VPTRYYLNRTEVNFTHLAPTSTATACPVTDYFWLGGV